MEQSKKIIGGITLLAMIAYVIFLSFIEVEIDKPNWTGVVKQPTPYSCGPACLKMLLATKGVKTSLTTLIQQTNSEKNHGCTLLTLQTCAAIYRIELVGYQSNDLTTISCPAIAHVSENHFVVMDSVKNDTIFYRDPLNGFKVSVTAEFSNKWTGSTLQLDNNK